MYLSFALESFQEALTQSHKLLTWLDLGTNGRNQRSKSFEVFQAEYN